jgi:hypothetical protein
MAAYIVVVKNPYFAQTGADGAYRINGVPAGQYSVRCWHERLAALRLVHFVVREALGLPREFLLFTEHSS